MNRKQNTLKHACAAVVGLVTLFGIGFAFSAIEIKREIKCQFDPEKGGFNPLGTRAFITVIESGGNTSFKYEQFARPVPDTSTLESGKSARIITIENVRELIFYETDLETAREQVRMNLDYYYALIGYEDRAGYSTYDESMTCK